MAAKAIKRTEAVLILNRFMQKQQVSTNSTNRRKCFHVTVAVGTGTDLNTISNVLSKTLFKERVYNAQFKGRKLVKEFCFYRWKSYRLLILISKIKSALVNDGVDMYRFVSALQATLATISLSGTIYQKQSSMTLQNLLTFEHAYGTNAKINLNKNKGKI